MSVAGIVDISPLLEDSVKSVVDSLVCSELDGSSDVGPVVISVTGTVDGVVEELSDSVLNPVVNVVVCSKLVVEETVVGWTVVGWTVDGCSLDVSVNGAVGGP